MKKKQYRPLTQEEKDKYYSNNYKNKSNLLRNIATVGIPATCKAIKNNLENLKDIGECSSKNLEDNLFQCAAYIGGGFSLIGKITLLSAEVGSVGYGAYKIVEGISNYF